MYNYFANAESPFTGLEATLSVADIGGHMVDLFAEVWVIVALAVAIPLAFYLVQKLRQILPGR